MITRFAPSPTGPLHLGHAFSALTAWRMTEAQGGTFLLRIEDIDQSRARPEWEALIYEDLHWLGLDWPMPPLRQSDRLTAYAGALDALWAAGLLYPCTCTRKDIIAAASAPQEGAPMLGPDGVVYPGTCRTKHPRSGKRPENAVLRLDMARSLERVSAPVFQESGAGPGGQSGVQRSSAEDMVHQIGDVVLARREMGTSYHLSVVVDDAHQAISHVVRGADLFEATPIHVLLQTLLGVPTPVYHHHRLVRDAAGKRLAKRDDARAIRQYRADGWTPDNVIREIGLKSGV